MKKVVTIVMLTLLIYNSVGYYIVFHFQQIAAENEFEEYIENTIISDSDLTVFKVPVNQYTLNKSHDFNRVEGDFLHNGKFYEKIKEKVENDTVYVYCLNNEKEEQLYHQLTDHVLTHLMGSKTDKHSKSGKSIELLLKKYLPNNSFLCASLIPITNKKRKITIDFSLWSSYIPKVSSPPPKAA